MSDVALESFWADVGHITAPDPSSVTAPAFDYDVADVPVQVSSAECPNTSDGEHVLNPESSWVLPGESDTEHIDVLVRCSACGRGGRAVVEVGEFSWTAER